MTGFMMINGVRNIAAQVKFSMISIPETVIYNINALSVLKRKLFLAWINKWLLHRLAIEMSKVQMSKIKYQSGKWSKSALENSNWQDIFFIAWNNTNILTEIMHKARDKNEKQK